MSWRGKWGVFLLNGFVQAATAQVLIPMAFAILCAVAVMLPLLRGTLTRVGSWIGLISGLTWVVGYALGLAPRYIWVAVAGPWLGQIQGELRGSAPEIYLTESVSQPFYAVVGLLMKTWFAAGWMQVGLLIAFGVFGWILGRGGAVGLLHRQVLITASPILIGVAWLLVWAGHTNHTFVHVLLCAMLLCALFSADYARRRRALP